LLNLGAQASPQDQSREIDLWIANDEDFLPEFDKGGERILGRSGFANASLSVKRDLTQSTIITSFSCSNRPR
jgi:hypothetical protein